MRKKLMILIFMVIFVILTFAACVFMLFADRIEDNTKTEKKKQEAIQDTMSLDETIYAFADTIYSYDTKQRNYYEGAEKFMTPEGFDRFVPLHDEAQEDGAAVQMSSILQEFDCYYKPVDDRHMEAIAEIWFTLSGTGEFRIRQLIKLSIIRDDDSWKIDECTILDTLEE